MHVDLEKSFQIDDIIFFFPFLNVYNQYLLSAF